ncbi:PLAC8-domain-containing protein [Mytilinidion resinicola]|uniref:PLAC8-domain-containing protein n=1 Tax=Mytilinidion resinicola TaxID=574789 RepID=A0A6A6YJG0_9PEZI|nr:PLAC8-domain-containing protein [Mytilinidion resinicola]KAF2808996.1 PLAC8-domain-containing protein [Mytilinidion resinicola]
MYPGQPPQQNPRQNRPQQPRLQLPDRQHKRFSWQASTEDVSKLGNGHRATGSVDSQWSYEETPVHMRHPRDPIQRLAREPDMSTIAQSPVTPIDTRPQSIFNAQIPQTTQAPAYSATEYPPEKSGSAFQGPPPPQAPHPASHPPQSPVSPLPVGYPQEKPSSPYNVPPPSQTHPAMYAPIVESRTPVSPLPQHQRASQYAPAAEARTPVSPYRQSMPRQSMPFMLTPIQIPSYTRQRTPNQTPITPSRIPDLPTNTKTPITPHSPAPFNSHTPVSPPHSPGALPLKKPIDFDLPSPTFMNRQRPLSAHNDTPYSPTSAVSAHIPVFSPNAPTGPNGLELERHQPGQIAHPNMDLSARGESHEWKHGLCECGGDVGTCMTGLFCPCVLYGRTAYRLSQRSQKKDPTELLGYSAFNGQCGVMASACGMWCLFPLVQRTRLRHLYKLTGSLFSDIGKACCCCCCVAIQNEREIRDREESSRRWAGPANTETYTAPGQMVYAPPPRG